MEAINLLTRILNHSSFLRTTGEAYVTAAHWLHQSLDCDRFMCNASIFTVMGDL